MIRSVFFRHLVGGNILCICCSVHGAMHSSLPYVTVCILRHFFSSRSWHLPRLSEGHGSLGTWGVLVLECLNAVPGVARSSKLMCRSDSKRISCVICLVAAIIARNVYAIWTQEQRVGNPCWTLSNVMCAVLIHFVEMCVVNNSYRMLLKNLCDRISHIDIFWIVVRSIFTSS